MSDTQTLVRKFQLIPAGDKNEVDRVYKYLRDGMYNQNKAYNILVTHMYSAIYMGRAQEEINEILKKGQRKPKESDPSYSLYKYGEIEFPIGMQTQSSVARHVQADIKAAKEKGLFKGRISLQNRKLDAPLWIESRQFSFYHEYPSYDDFMHALMKGKPEIFMKFVNGITFKVIFGKPKRSYDMRAVFRNIFEEVYALQGSSIQFDKTGKKIIKESGKTQVL